MVRDAQSNGQALYFGHATTDVPESHYEMPSSFTGFDARFATNAGMMSFNHDSYTVNLKSNSFPMTMAFSNVAGTVTVTDMAGNTLGTVTGNGIVTIAQPLTQVKIAMKSTNGMAVAGYQLMPNTPNP